MRADEAYAIVAELGLTDHVRAVADEAPPLTSGQTDLVRRLFATATEVPDRASAAR